MSLEVYFLIYHQSAVTCIKNVHTAIDSISSEISILFCFVGVERCRRQPFKASGSHW